MTSPQELLTVAEVACQLGVSVWTVRRHIDAGHVPDALDVGAGSAPRYRIPASAVATLRRKLRTKRPR